MITADCGGSNGNRARLWKELEVTRISGHSFRPDWNYAIRPFATPKTDSEPTSGVKST
ncbi:hypothetical protein [Streptosporangium carneum]|uniref:hypothetical protein n=1 Tax=Streptosporangium carneum TaxID=47481 RepID=UPI0022F2F928|nr:hypothetical protein [Streptosporangium carneum]